MGVKSRGVIAKKRKSKFNKLIPYSWLLPSILIIAIFVIYPIYELLITSISEISISGIRKELSGLSNYRALFSDPVFYLSLKNTLIWTVSVVGFSTIFAIGIASLLNLNFPGQRLVRAALIIPWAVSLIITAAIWKYIFNYNYGIVNLILMKLGIINENIYWIAQPASSFSVMIFVGIFVTIPFTTFIILSGIQSISTELYEAANVDGAGIWKRFTSITLPLLKPSITVSVVLNTIYVFNSFPIIWTITQGDPANKTDLIITYLYKLAFGANKTGEAAAASVISFCILLLFAIAYISLTLRGGSKNE